MFSNFTVDWKESLIILLGLLVVILLYYAFNRKSIARENEAKKLYKTLLEENNMYNLQQETMVENRKSTPQTVQAYERFIILMERIDLQKLVGRVSPISSLKQDYASFLIQNIEQEYDFNISQQLYISEEAWALIATAKQTIIQQILKTSLKEDVLNASDLQQKLMMLKDTNSVTEIAKNRLKQEFKTLV